MHVISRRRLVEAAIRYPQLEKPLTVWYKIAKAAKWTSLSETQAIYPHADQVRVWSKKITTVFNIKGNDFRLIAAIHYDRQKIFILRILTHADYSANAWKNQL